MCGILGIASNDNCTNALIEGLKKLAYRGYDSAGLATVVNKEIVKRVALGKIGNLKSIIKEKPKSRFYKSNSKSSSSCSTTPSNN